MDENYLELLKDADNTVARYHNNPSGFMEQLVKDNFNVANTNSATPTTIWKYFSVYTSSSGQKDPREIFSSHYKKIFRTEIPKNRAYWKNYLGQIGDFLTFLDVNGPAREAARNETVYSYARHQGLTEEQIASIQHALQNNKADLMEQMVRAANAKKNTKQSYNGSYLPESTKGIQGSKSIIAERKAGIQGAKLLSERKILSPNPQSQSSDMEVLRADTTPEAQTANSNASPVSRVMKPLQTIGTSTRKVLPDVEHGLTMGAIQAGPNIKSAVGGFARSILHEAGTIITPQGSQERIVQRVDVNYPQRSSRGVSVSNITSIPKTITRFKNAQKTAQLIRVGSLAARATLMENPVFIAAMVALLIFFLVFILPDNFNILKTTILCGPDTPCGQGGEPESGVTPNTLVELFKGGDRQVANGQDIRYNITVEYIGPGTANVTLQDRIPDGLEFHADRQDPGFTGTNNNGTIEWRFDNMAINRPQLVFLILTPTRNDFYVINSASASITSTAGYLGGGDNLLPTPLPDPPPNWDAVRAQVLAAIAANPASIAVYQQAAAITGVPWELLAGIHFEEGGMNQNTSLVNGQPLGVRSIDLNATQCGPGVTPGPGVPVPAPGGGCTFFTELDSAIYAANLLVQKNRGQPIVSFFDAVRAASLYNGGGNQNCGWNPPTPYQNAGNCAGPGPDGADFLGEDDAYAMSDFDVKHYDQSMYLIFCGQNAAGGIRCNPPRVYGNPVRPGVMAVIRVIATAP